MKAHLCTKWQSVRCTTGVNSPLCISFEVKMKSLQVPPITYEMARSLVKPMKVRNANDVAKALIEQEFKKRGL